MGWLARLEKQHYNQTFAIAPKFRIRQNSCVNTPVNIPREQDKLADAKSDASSNKVFTPSKVPTLPFILHPTENLFMKFLNAFMETMQAQALAESRVRLLKARTPKTYWDKSHIEC